MERVSEDFGEIGRSSLEMMFALHGTAKVLVLVFEQDGIVTVQRVLIEGEEDAEKLHAALLYTIAELIRILDVPELFVGYEGFYLVEDMAVRILIGTLYSDDEERVWMVQTHGSTIGEWQDISGNRDRCGFEGLWKEAKAYRWN